MSRSARRALRVEAGQTTVVFEWMGDRWGHRVLVGGVAVAESVEGADHEAHADPRTDPRWPASPAIIELTGGEATTPHLLGVGATGRSHFSLVVTPDPTAADTLLFELACRFVDPPGWLGSTYRSAPPDAAGVAVAPLPAPQPGPRPQTARWSYTIGPRGILPQTNATLAAAG